MDAAAQAGCLGFVEDGHGPNSEPLFVSFLQKKGPEIIL